MGLHQATASPSTIGPSDLLSSPATPAARPALRPYRTKQYKNEAQAPLEAGAVTQ